MRMVQVRLEDVEDLLRLMKAMQQDDPWAVPFEVDQVRKTLEELLSNPNLGLVWFIEEDERRIGYIVMGFDYSIEFGGRNAWIDEFFVEREWRGRGIGAQVLTAFEEAARQAGASAMHLGVSQGNRAIELYRRHGFREHQGIAMVKLLE